MDTLTHIILDIDIHSDTNDIICYIIVFWELNSYWGNFKKNSHGEWNEKIWIVYHVWNCLDSETVKLFGQFVVYKICTNCFCELNDEIWTIIVGFGRQIFAHIVYVSQFGSLLFGWIDFSMWTDFFMWIDLLNIFFLCEQIFCTGFGSLLFGWIDFFYKVSVEHIYIYIYIL